MGQKVLSNRIRHLTSLSVFADVIKANGVTVFNRVDLPDSAVIYEAEAPIFRNSPLVRKVVEELKEMDGSPEPSIPR